VPGKSIFHSAHGTAIDPAEVIRLVSDICQGLAHAHENGIIHRDIKPSNILLDLNAQPKIGDFGLARPIERKIQEGEEIFGTPHYTAPEVVDAPHSVDYRADIFSVGVMLHELLTGRLPADDPRPASLIAHCDARFDAIIRRATQPQPAARYASATEVAADLQAIATQLPPPSAAALMQARPTAPRRRNSPTRPKKSSGTSSVFFLLAATAAVAAYFYFPRKPPVKVIVVPPPAAVATRPVEPLVSQENVAPSNLLPDPVPAPVVGAVVVPETTDGVVAETADDVVTAAAKFDVAGFFERARKIMKERAAPLVNAHNVKLKNNASGLRRDMERLIRKEYYYRDTAEAEMEEYAADWTKAGNRLPPTMSGWVGRLPGATKIYTEHLEKQTECDALLKSKIDPLAETYILGLNKQIERLKADKDVGAIALVEEEIELTKASPEYFSELMMASTAASQ
jgi:hypothetical protein